MLPFRSGYLLILAFASFLLSGFGCGGEHSTGRLETQRREAKLDGMTCTLTIKSQKDPELNWAVTDRVLASFSGHQVEVDNKQVTFDGKSKPIPKGTQDITIDFENDAVTIRAGGKPLFGPSAP